ncbi:MAG TPA: sulfite exporter TauE/SafE family protein [Phycisphaerales bacterium]
MTPLIAGIFVASLLGSLHCAGMCGAFLALAVTPDEESRVGKASLHVAYNAGRLCSYTTLGLVAGLVGRSLDLGGEMVGVQRAAAIGASLIMIGFGLIAVARAQGYSIRRLHPPRALQAAVQKAYAAAGAWSPLGRAYAIGLLTTALPCGWLYAFVLTAAGTGDPLSGALAMAAFWLGTLPVMAALGVGLQSLFGPMRRHLPMATALLLVIVGVISLAGRVRHMRESAAISEVFCHGG